MDERNKFFQNFLNPRVHEPTNLRQQEVKNQISMERRGSQMDEDRLIVGRVKLASSTSPGSNCGSQKFWVQDVYHETKGYESSITPIQELVAININNGKNILSYGICLELDKLKFKFKEDLFIFISILLILFYFNSIFVAQM